MTNNYHIDVKKIAANIWTRYAELRTQEKVNWEKEFDKWIKGKKKNLKDDF